MEGDNAHRALADSRRRYAHVITTGRKSFAQAGFHNQSRRFEAEVRGVILSELLAPPVSVQVPIGADVHDDIENIGFAPKISK